MSRRTYRRRQGPDIAIRARPDRAHPHDDRAGNAAQGFEPQVIFLTVAMNISCKLEYVRCRFS